jgi:hypothetical protein
MTIYLDDTWSKNNLEFLNAWVTRVLDLDQHLPNPSTDTQKRVWLTNALSTKAMLATSISQFMASEKVTRHSLGTYFKEAPFSLLFDHVKDDAIQLDHAEHRLQVSLRKANEHRSDSTSARNSRSGNVDQKKFMGRDGKNIPTSSLQKNIRR